MIEQWHAFVRIAERGSITAAARDLGVTQATASRRLQALEAALGCSLVVRTTHFLRLTPAGEQALPRVRELLGSWDALRESTSDSAALHGPIGVVAPVALGQDVLVRSAAAFLADHPGVQLRWELVDGDIRFLETGADLWVKVGPVLDDRLVVDAITQVERIVVSAPGVGTLQAGPWIALAPFEDRQIPLSNGRRNQTLDIQPVLRTTDILAARTAALAGVGLAVMPRWLVATALQSGHLIEVAPGWQAPSLAIHVVRLPGRPSRRVTAFSKALAQALHTLDHTGPT